MNKKMILSLVDRVVKVDRGGPESRIGKLLAVQDDHLTLLTDNDGIIYYNTQHIKSLTINTKNQDQVNIEVPEDFEFIQADDFKGVLRNLTLRWVKINRGGPETLEGVMDYVDDDYITIVSNEEIIRISLFHIRNISYGVKLPKEDEAENKNESKKDSE
ncbi:MULTISPECIES: hypothetical protein [unclassified Bacillus (in: firmicutes)]|uniref:hypothetical protein n=1 Tax=Bacillaceae TaxID=186817 RepID=UPI0006B01A05|nr:MULTISPECIES: hypothetical protein [unclassified Bacillus (in: firmicutes)]ALC86260.1 hypothetical protein AM499_10770 [Bacillus sp. FJAT-22090]MDF2065717.1 hypothetical protein [Bacillus sp. Cr_A10]